MENNNNIEVQRKGNMLKYPNYAKREEKEFDELISHHIPDDWPDDLIYTSSLMWEVSEEMQQRYREYSTLQECSQIRFRKGRLVLHTIIDLQETCLVDEYTGYIVSDNDLVSCLKNPNRVFLHYTEEPEEYLWVDSSQIGNETRYMRRAPKGSEEVNAKLQHIILDGEMRVFVELTKDMKMGEEFVVEHFVPRHLDAKNYPWEDEQEDYFTTSANLLQSCIFGQAPQLIYDKLNDDHPILRAKRCLWDYVVIGDIKDKNHPCFGQRGCFARVFLPKGTYIGQYTGEVWVCNGSSMSMYVAKYSNSYDEKNTEDVRIDSEKYGNETRYFNDYRNTGRETNAQFVMVWIAGTLQLYVGATRDIDKGEEILIDYGPEYWDAVKDMNEYEVYEKKYQKELEEYEDYRRQLKEYAEYQRDLLKYRDNYFKQYASYPTDIDDLDKEFSYDNWLKEEETFIKDHGYQTKPPEERKRLEELRLHEEKEKENKKQEEKVKKWGVEMRSFEDDTEKKLFKGTTSIKRVTVFAPKRPTTQNNPKKDVPERDPPPPPENNDNSNDDNSDNVIDNNNDNNNGSNPQVIEILN